LKSIHERWEAAFVAAFCFFSLLAGTAIVFAEGASSPKSIEDLLGATQAEKLGSSSEDELLLFPAVTASPPLFLTPDPLSTTLRILSSLAIVILLVFGLSWLIQRRGPLGSPSMGRLLGAFPLDARRHLYVVDILGKVLVLGITEHHISILSEITDKSVLDGLRVNADKPSTPGLENIFSFLSRNKTGTSAPGQEEPFGAENLSEHTRRANDQVRKIGDLLIKRPDNKDRD